MDSGNLSEQQASTGIADSDAPDRPSVQVPAPSQEQAAPSQAQAQEPQDQSRREPYKLASASFLMMFVELALIKQIILGDELTEIKMVLTTPFCPYAGALIQQIEESVEEVVQHQVKVTLLAERWDPRDAGLVW